MNKKEDVWAKYDIEFSDILSTLENNLDTDTIILFEAGNTFNSLLTNFLGSKPNVVKQVKTFYKHKPSSMKNINDAQKLKIDLEKKTRQKSATQEDKVLAAEALRHYSFILKEQSKLEEAY